MNPDLFNLVCGGLYLSLILLIGYAVLCAILQPGVRHWAELLGFCFAAGAGVLSFILFAVSVAGAKPGRVELVVIAFIALTAIISIWRCKGVVRGSIPFPRRKPDLLTPLGILGFGLILAATGNVAARANWPGLNDTDVFAIWLFKAKWVALFPLRPLPAVFTDPTLSYSHQDYPLSLPFLVVGLYAVFGKVDDNAAKMLCLPIYLSLMAIIYAAVRRIHRRAVALCITAIFIAAPTLCQNAGLVVAETPLLLALAGTATMLLRWIELGEAGDLTLAMLFADIAAFTKNEGLALLPVIGAATFLLAILRRKTTDWLVAGAVCVLAIGPWILWRIRLPKTHEDYGGKFAHPGLIFQNAARLGYILPRYFGRLFDASRAGLLWYVLVIAVLLGLRAFERSSVRVLWCVLAIQLLFYLVTFVVTPWDVAVLLPMIGPKLLTQASVMGVLLIALHLRDARRAGSYNLSTVESPAPLANR